MPISALLAIFIPVFLAELGDKTQLATMLFAAKSDHSPWFVFAAASFALVASTAMAVLLGSYLSKHVDMIPLKLIAGICFVLLGSWSIYEHFKV